MKNKFSKDIKDHFLQALTLDPQFSQAHYQLALFYELAGDNESAEIHLLKSIELDLIEIEEIEKKASHLLEHCQFQNAKMLFLKSLEIKNNCAISFHVLSCLYMNQLELSKTKDSLIKSIDLNPAYAKAHRDFGLLCLKNNDLVLAKQHLDLSLELDYGDHETHLYLGIIMKKNNDYFQAEQYFLAALDINSEYVDCLMEMAYLKILMKKKDEAKSFYEKAKKLSVDIQDEKLDLLIKNDGK